MFFKRQSAERDFDLLVLGGGSAAFGAAIRGAELGARVAVAEQGVIGGTCINRGCLPEPEISDALRSYLEAEGSEIHTNVRVIRVGQGEGVTVVRAELDGETRDFQAEKLLLAAGLRANTADIGLETVGVETDRRGAVVVDDELRTTAKNVWAAGDVVGKLM